MPHRVKTPPRQWWLMIVLHVVVPLVVGAASAGMTAATFVNRLGNVEKAIADIESSHPEKTAWQVDQHARDIASLQKSEADTATSIGRIEGRMARMETSLEFLVNAAKKP